MTLMSQFDLDTMQTYIHQKFISNAKVNIIALTDYTFPAKSFTKIINVHSKPIFTTGKSDDEITRKSLVELKKSHIKWHQWLDRKPQRDVPKRRSL